MTHADVAPEARADLDPAVAQEVFAADVALAQLTTMRVGGHAERILVARSSAELAEFARELWDDGEPWLLLGGGSNTVVSDDGFPGTLVLVRNTGIDAIADATLADGEVRVRVQAGHDWDALVAATVERGLAGIEALSGIPGLAGAAPVQNIGAYGCELADVLHSIEFLESGHAEPRRMSAAELELGYRDSAIKQGLEGVVLSIDLVLTDRSPAHGAHQVDGQGIDPDQAEATAPVRYAQLAQALGVELGAHVPLTQLRSAVLALRASKGMVLDAADHDTWSSGSFFTNPIVAASFAVTLPENAPRFPVQEAEVAPTVTSLEDIAAGAPLRASHGAAGTPSRQVKLSAAWLIEHAGIPRGYRLPGSGAAISSKHTLALTNQGGASAADVAELARFVVQRVQQEFGVILAPEPRLYGLEV
ncbi:UDP-N-acetylmuramate dehydrogenase [Leucobacter exalbidus]|uniref:UDP-N-acetylenolpyruvoylglucosamine reductase n=1 Tax=Leucobacter exalbidus TaxID=662960 RepID=A0A940PMW7_9MICO|nr:UDP-N-acetylmuramate dehydrogenase [Leucobacter exalbidus]